MKLNETKNEFLKIILIFIIGLTISWIVVKPIKNNIVNKNQEIDSSKKESMKSEKIHEFESNQYIKEDDIVLNIENEFSKFINVIYINKFVEWDENNNEYIKVELKVNGTIDQVFKINDEIEKIKGKNIIESIQINKKINDNVEIKEEIKDDTIDCVMTLKVG